MAGRGPVPKDPGQRRRYNQPARGEWIELELLEAPILGPYNRRRFSVPARMWNAWRNDAVTSQYGDADFAAIEELAVRYEGLMPSEQRLRMDGLGLTPKGKRDLRWRTPNEVKTIKAQQAGASVRKL